VTTVAVVLAAGAGTRFGGSTHKLDALLRGRPLLAYALGAALASGVGPVLVVTSDLIATARPEALPAGVQRVVNDDWRDGQSSSLRCGIAAAATAGADDVIIGLGDQPFVIAAAWRAIAATDGAIVAATYGGRRGHPVKLRRDVWHLLATTGDQGARTLMRLRPELVGEVPCDGSTTDVDTLEDLNRWQNNSSTSSP